MWWILGYFGMAVITAFLLGLWNEDTDEIFVLWALCWPLVLPVVMFLNVISAGKQQAKRIRERRYKRESLARDIQRDQERAAREVDRLLKSEGVL